MPLMFLKKKSFSLIFFLVPITFFLFINTKEAKENIQLQTNDFSITDNGKNIYLNNCASCHGEKLEGQKNWETSLPNGLMPAPPHNKTGHTWHHSDEYLFMITKFGIEEYIGKKYPNNMPAYKDILNDKEIMAVLSFIKSTWPLEIKKINNQINLRARKKR